MPEPKNQLMRFDGMANALSGFSGKQDKTSHSFFLLDYMRPDEELTAIWAGGGIGRKICTSRPDDMVRAWITVPEDTDGKILKALDQINARTALRDALYWTELYRGAIVALGGLDTAATMEAPFTKATKPLAWLKVYPASRILNDEQDLVMESGSKYFEDFEFFRVQQRFGGKVENKIHASRCIVSKGLPVPEDKNTTFEYKYIYWGMSRLQAVFQELANAATVQKSFGNLVHEATVGIFKLEGLAEILAGEDGGAKQLKTVMDSIARAKSVLNMLLIGQNDEFKRDTLTTSGWMDVAMMFRQEVAAAADSTVPRLYGIPSSGLGGGGSDEQAKVNYNDSIQADQETRLRPMIQRLISYIAPGLGLPEDIEFKFNPLTTPSEKEIVETRKTVAETDKIYSEIPNCLQGEEIRDSRWGGNSYSRETKLDPSLSSDDFEPPPAPVPPVAKVPAKAPTPPAKK